MKVRKRPFLSFRRKPESRNTKNFWTPAPVPDTDPGFAGVTAWRTFCETVKVVPWNFAISIAGMPGGRKTRPWTAQEAVAPFRPFSVKRRTALSTRTPPVPKKRKNPEELQHD